MGYQKVGYYQVQGGCSLVIGRASSPVKSLVLAVRTDEGRTLQIKAGGGSRWKSSRKGSCLITQSGTPHSGDDIIVLLYKELERLCGEEGLGQALPTCAPYTSLTTSKVRSQQARDWWPTSQSAETSLGYKSFPLSCFMAVGGTSIHRSGPDNF